MIKCSKILCILCVTLLILNGAAACTKPQETNPISEEYDIFESDATFIESTGCQYFIYDCKIEINSIPTTDPDLISVLYQIEVTMKDETQTYDNVLVTCKLNDSVCQIQRVPREYFGTLLGEKNKLSSDIPGIIITLATWLQVTNQTSLEDLHVLLEEPVLVKINCDQVKQYVTIQPSSVTIKE